MGVLLPQTPARLLERVRHALDEQHAEDELFVLGGGHLAAQDVRGPEEEALQLGERYFVSSNLVKFYGVTQQKHFDAAGNSNTGEAARLKSAGGG